MRAKLLPLHKTLAMFVDLANNLQFLDTLSYVFKIFQKYSSPLN